MVGCKTKARTIPKSPSHNSSKYSSISITLVSGEDEREEVGLEDTRTILEPSQALSLVQMSSLRSRQDSSELFTLQPVYNLLTLTRAVGDQKRKVPSIRGNCFFLEHGGPLKPKVKFLPNIAKKNVRIPSRLLGFG